MRLLLTLAGMLLATVAVAALGVRSASVDFDNKTVTNAGFPSSLVFAP